MASVYKPKSDRKRKGARWMIAYTEDTGRRRTVRGYTDKAATERLAAKLESEAAQRRDGLIDPRDEAYRRNESKPLVDHLSDWHADLANRGNTAKHADLSRSRVARLLDIAGAKRITDL